MYFLAKRWKFCLILVICLLVTYFSNRRVNAQTSPTVTVDFSTPVAQGSPLIFGGTSTPQWQPIQQLGWDKLQEVGVTFIRQDLALETYVPTSTVTNYQANVGNIQNPNSWDQGSLDYIANKFLDAQKRGMKTMVIVDYAPPWLTYTGQQTGVPKDWSVWEDIVKKSLQYMQSKGVHFDYYEVWNEPGDQWQDQFFDVTGSGLAKPEAYVQLYYHTWNAIKAVDPAAKVGGPADYQIDSAKTNITYMLNSSLVKNKIDFVSYHYYDQLHQYLITSSQFFNLPAGTNSAVAIKNVLTSLGRSDIPIILSEYNYTCCSKPGSANTKESVLFMAQNFIGLLKAGVLAANYFTTSSDFCNAAQQYLCFYQIINGQAVLQPEAYVWRLASQQLGLGKGASQIYSTTQPAGIDAVGAINSSGQATTLLANASDTSQTINLQFINSNFQGALTASIYTASLSNDPQAPSQTQTLTATNGTYTLPLTIPAWTALGVVLTPNTVPASSLPSPTASTSPACAADINQDGNVNLIDYSLLVSQFLKSPLTIPQADLNHDGQVNLLDYSILVTSFLQPCTTSTPLSNASPLVSPIPTPTPLASVTTIASPSPMASPKPVVSPSPMLSPSPVPSPSSSAISNLALISTTDGSQIQTLSSPVTFTVAQLNTQTLKALTSGAVQSVKWTTTSSYNATPIIATDNGQPFTIVCDGNAIGWYCPWNVGVGTYQVTAEAYDQPQAQGNKIGSTTVTIQVQ